VNASMVHACVLIVGSEAIAAIALEVNSMGRKLRRCVNCGYTAMTTSDGHRLSVDGVRVYCGTMRVVRDEVSQLD
jgi:superfamily I DNA and RNA helicase